MSYQNLLNHLQTSAGSHLIWSDLSVTESTYTRIHYVNEMLFQ